MEITSIYSGLVRDITNSSWIYVTTTAASKQNLRMVALLFAAVTAAFTCPAAGDDSKPQVVYAAPFISSRESQFRLGVEGAAVDPSGRMYATAYKAFGSSGVGLMAEPNGTVHQRQFFLDQTGSISFNGLRFLPLSPDLSESFLSRAVGTDVRGKQLVYLLQGKREERVRAYPFCGDPRMAQPNDIAVATKSGRVYLSGGNFAKLTTEVGDGDLWMCETGSSFFDSVVTDLDRVGAKRLGQFGITNGIELSPDESTLYMAETFHANGVVIQNVVWKFDVDSKTGDVFNKTLVVDFRALDGTEWIDVDGIRADSEGNLFIARNGPENTTNVVKVSPDGTLLLNIEAPDIFETTNCELGGKDGKTLFLVGKCVVNPSKGCVSVWNENSHPGRAWMELTGSPVT